MYVENEISIVVPCYNEEEVLHQFYKEVTDVLENTIRLKNYEILFVDDGSKDRTGEILEQLCKKDVHAQYLSFSRNFGKESAIYAGLLYADGAYTVVMDADLQHPPHVISQMYDAILTGNYDMVATRRENRKTDSRIRAVCGSLFYQIMNRISGIDMGSNAMDFRMLNRKAKKAVLSMAEYNRFSKGIFEWIGFRTYWLEIEVADRKAGSSKWSFRNLFLYSLEGCIAFSTLPLSLSSIFGFLFCTIAVFIILAMVVQAFISGTAGSGYATIICTILLVSGVQLFCTGILGQYLAKTYLEIKHRPKYLIQNLSEGKKNRSECRTDEDQ